MDLIAIALDSMCAWGAVRICAQAVARVFAIAFAFVDKLVEGFDIEPTLITVAYPTDPTYPVLSSRRVPFPYIIAFVLKKGLTDVQHENGMDRTRFENVSISIHDRNLTTAVGSWPDRLDLGLRSGFGFVENPAIMGRAVCVRGEDWAKFATQWHRCGPGR
jgi:hypothetical protein